MPEIPDYFRKQLEREAWGQEANPLKFPSRVQITDDAALELVTNYMEAVRVVDRARYALQAAEATAAVFKSKLFSRLLETYPDVQTLEYAQTGIRRLGHDYYYISY